MERTAQFASFEPIREAVDFASADILATRAEPGSTAEQALLVALGEGFQMRMNKPADMALINVRLWSMLSSTR